MISSHIDGIYTHTLKLTWDMTPPRHKRMILQQPLMLESSHQPIHVTLETKLFHIFWKGPIGMWQKWLSLATVTMELISAYLLMIEGTARWRRFQIRFQGSQYPFWPHLRIMLSCKRERRSIRLSCSKFKSKTIVKSLCPFLLPSWSMCICALHLHKGYSTHFKGLMDSREFIVPF